MKVLFARDLVFTKPILVRAEDCGPVNWGARGKRPQELVVYCAVREPKTAEAVGLESLNRACDRYQADVDGVKEVPGHGERHPYPVREMDEV